MTTIPKYTFPHKLLDGGMVSAKRHHVEAAWMQAHGISPSPNNHAITEKALGFLKRTPQGDYILPAASYVRAALLERSGEHVKIAGMFAILESSAPPEYKMRDKV